MSLSMTMHEHQHQFSHGVSRKVQALLFLTGILFHLGSYSRCDSTKLPYTGDCNHDGIHDNEVVQWLCFLVTQDDHNFFVPETRELAIIYAGVHDAVNTIQPTYEFFYQDCSLTSQLSPMRIAAANVEAAVASAAYQGWQHALTNRLSPYVPYTAAYSNATLAPLLGNLTAFYQSRIATIQAAAGTNRFAVQSVNDGISLGQKAVLDLFAARNSDGWSRAVPQYDPTHFGQPGYTPGSWYSYAAPKLFQFSQWPQVAMFISPANTSFLTGPPLDPNSAAYQADLHNTYLFGGSSPTSPTQATTANVASANWWNTLSNGFHGSLLTANLAADANLSVIDTAHAAALVQLAIADAMIINICDKFIYNYWRPYQATNNGGFPTITVDPAWVPNVVTPNSPEYPAGHPTIAGAAAGVLQLLFGFQKFPRPLSIQYEDTIPAQNFTSFADWNNQVIWARIYGGMHLQFSGLQGNVAGNEIGSYVVGRSLRALKGWS